MSTYVTSDIHGHKTEFDAMLEKIGFSGEDEMHVLGDIIDKGPESGEMLVWAVESAPENIHFLMGNHEDMAYSALKEYNGTFAIPYDSPWDWNDGWNTLRGIARALGEEYGSKTCVDWAREKLLPWIDSLPTHELVEVGGKQFMLVHAGFNPFEFESVPEDERKRGWYDCNCDRHAHSKDEHVGYGFGSQEQQSMMWERIAWLTDDADAPVETVFGHTYMSDSRIAELEGVGCSWSGGSGKIAHFRNKHGIDCGCAYEDRYPELAREGKLNLACLRLDDMEEFYVPITGSSE